MSSLFIVLFCFLSRKTSYIRSLGIPVLLLLLLVTVVRALFPVELPFAKLIVSESLLPRIYTFLRSPLFPGIAGVNLLSVIGFIWISGTGIQTVKLIRSYYGLRKSLKFCPVKSDIEQSVLLRAASNFKLPKHLNILETSAITTPMVFGFFAPTIVFPMLSYTSEELYFILRHELEHYRNKDIWVKTGVELICAVYWWNPLAYALRERTERVLEMKVDLSISALWEEAQRLKYLAFLIHTYKKTNLSANKMAYGTLGIVDGRDRSTMRQRFEILLSRGERICSKATLLLAGAVSILMLVLSFSCIVQPQYPPPAENETNGYALTPDNAYLVQRPDGEYDVYISKIGYFTTIQKIEEPYTGLSIK